MSNSLIHKKSVWSLSVTRAAPCFQILDELLHVDLVHEDEVPEADTGVYGHVCLECHLVLCPACVLCDTEAVPILG